MKNPNKKFSNRIVWLSLMVLAMFSVSPLAMAQSGARLFLQPVESANGVVTVDVVAENVTDLYGLEVHLKYDPAVLAPQDAKPEQNGVQIEVGSLLPASQGFVVANQAKEAEGEITFAMTLLNPAPAVSGSGPVARVSFKVLQAVPATIDIEKATLVSVNLETIPVETAPLSIGNAPQGEAGDSTNSPAAAIAVDSVVADNSFPWWIVAAAVLLLGIVAIGAFVVMGGFVQSQPQVAVERPRMAENMGRGRPSAFKEQALPKPPQSRQ
jgi:hypothetical protein